MTSSGLFGFLIVLGVVLAAVPFIGRRSGDASLMRVTRQGLLLRVLGALCYFGLVTSVYGGGDFLLYFNAGNEYAQRIWAGDLSAFYEPEQWLGGNWWGTQFLISTSGVVLSVIGTSLLGGFLAFSLFGFAGLLLFGRAFERSFPTVPAVGYYKWLLLFPSLWFWPSAIGKEPVILLGLGLCAAGYVGRLGRINWMMLGAGFLLVFAVRPQVAMVVCVAMLIAQWASWGERWTFLKTVQGVLILAVAITGLWSTANQLGFEAFDAEEVVEYMETRAAGAAIGGTSIAGTEVGWRSVPIALVNTLFRPFPWEVQSITGLLSSLEILALWMAVFYKRRTLMAALRNWRAARATRLALPFVLLYAATLGMVLVNLGIIARQRILIFPFLFLFLEAMPSARRVARRTMRPLVERGQRGQPGAPDEPRTVPARATWG